MKARFLFLIIVIVLVGLGWWGVNRSLVVKAAPTGPDYVIRVTIFDSSVYDPARVDQPMTNFSLIESGDFVRAVMDDNPPLPFQTAGDQDLNKMNELFDNIENETCGGVDECDSQAFSMQIVDIISNEIIRGAAAVAANTCLINISVFDKVVLDTKITWTDDLLRDAKLIDEGTLISAIQDQTLPFNTKGSDETTIKKLVDQLKIGLCGGVDKCDSKIFAAQSVCESSGTTTIAVAKTALATRISNMNPCQREVFSNLQVNSVNYLKAVKKENLGYYRGLAPETVKFRRAYQNAKDKKERQIILDTYIAKNKGLRQDLYIAQTEVFDDFLNIKSQLDNDFTGCNK